MTAPVTTIPAAADADQVPAEVAASWRTAMVLKRDIFSTVERGTFRIAGREVPAVLRRIDRVPFWTRPIAQHFLRREAKALALAGHLGFAPPLLFEGRASLVRGWLDGLPLHIAKPHGNAAFFASATKALTTLRRNRIAHNDLAKEQNWLVGPAGQAYLTDFQLAQVFRRKRKTYRVLAYEDLRHLLKHKRKYLPDSLTGTERRILARKGLPARIWMATGKKVYIAISRGIFRFTDREGGGPRLVNDAPKIAAALRAVPGVREAVVVAYPDRRSGTGLYAFVETERTIGEAALRKPLEVARGSAQPPELLQEVSALPRSPDGTVRTEILQLVATNQVDLLEPLIRSAEERAIVDRLVAGRVNLRDRFSY